MSEQPEALRLADALTEAAGDYWQFHKSIGYGAAAELRRLHAENERLATLVCDYAAEEAPDALRTVAADRDRWHTKAQQAEAQRNALLAALRYWLPDETMIPAGHEAKWHESVAAIKAVEEGK